MAHVLLVEDDDTLGMTLEMTLQACGHDVRWCTTLAAARAAVAEEAADLVLLDLGLPDGDGMDLCRELRATGHIAPVLMLTARGTLDARVRGLELGADDYVPKPFELPELLARIEALLRRQRWHHPTDEARVGLLRVDFRTHRAWRDDAPVALTDLELKLLRYLLERPGQVVRREELLERVWNVAPSTRTRTVDVFVGRLRRAVEADPSRPRYLQNVRGAGYRLVPEPDDG